MSTRFNTCRFCEGPMSDDLVKYGTRHYAHHKCFLEAGKPLAQLPIHVLEQFPYFLLKEYGRLIEVEFIIKSKKAAHLQRAYIAGEHWAVEEMMKQRAQS